MNHQGTKVLHTKRLILRPFCASDAEDMFFNYASDPEVSKYLTWLPHKSVEDSKELCELWQQESKDSKNYQWAIEHEGHVIGSTSVTIMNEQMESCEIGYCLGRPWWGMGIMPEAVSCMIDYLFDEVGFYRIAAVHNVDNPKSGRVMQKVGMQYEGVIRKAHKNSVGERVDIAQYAILKTDRK